MNKRPLVADCAALLAGCLFPLSLDPFGFWIVAVVSVAILFAAVEQGSVRRTLLRFYLFNVGMFLMGASWIYVSIHEHGNASPVLAGTLVALAVLGYSLISLPQAYVYARFLRSTPLSNIVSFSVLWIFQEWFRTWILTGFPWLYLGYGFLGTYLGHYAPVSGVFAVSLAACLVSACLVVGVTEKRFVLIAPVILIIAMSLTLSKVEFTDPAGSVSVSLVQGNIDQHIKWKRESVEPILNTYTNLSRTEWGQDIVVWPEAAVTLFKENATGFLQSMDQVARTNNSTLILGIPDRNDTGGFQNTVVALGEGSGQYIKKRLVPFGEYVPFENLLRGVIEFFDLPMSRNQPGPQSQVAITAGDLTLSVSICYEVVYPEIVRTNVENPDLLLTVSNDTWFGSSIGPWQHLQMAQMRALENGRPMIRATNNGVTALVDHRGRLISTLPQFEQGVLRGEVEVRSGRTPFGIVGHLPLLLLCFVGVLAIGSRQWLVNRGSKT